jgi:hypothetical protein
MAQAVPQDATWPHLLRQAQEVAPEAFIPGGSVLNLMEDGGATPVGPKRASPRSTAACWGNCRC